MATVLGIIVILAACVIVTYGFIGAVKLHDFLVYHKLYWTIIPVIILCVGCVELVTFGHILGEYILRHIRG